MQINYALLLKTSLEVIPGLLNAVKNANTQFFQDFVEVNIDYSEPETFIAILNCFILLGVEKSSVQANGR